MEIYDRQIRVFGKEGQKAIQKLTVGIVGGGGIGSMVLVLIVWLGVKRIIIIDPDVVELSNLNRLAGATLQDVLKKIPKVLILARYAAKINPKIKVIPIQKSILDKKAQRCLKACDVIFGCTDNQSSRWVLNKFSVEHLIPYFDTGTGIQADPRQNIEHAGGQVRVVIPGMGCLNCIDGINIATAQQEMLPEPDRQVALQLGYIAGADVSAPAVASLNSVIASLAVTEFMAFATGFKPLNRFIFYDFMNARVTSYTFKRDPNCFTCSETGSFAIGDKGANLPAEMLIDEPEPQKPNEGETKMQTQNKDTKQSIAELLSRAQQNGLGIEGSAEGQWLVINNLKLGKQFNKPIANVMIKFLADSKDPVILVPENLNVSPDSQICPNFVGTIPCFKGWKPLCPHMFQEVADEILEFVACLTGFLANPALCGLMGCEGRALVQRRE
jgi:molybdopterin/thiamine biosynthesis adenylyltransferase